MKHKAAKRDLSVKIVTAVVIIIALGFIIASFYLKVLVVAALIMLVVIVVCYLYAPTAFEIIGNKLVVYRNYGMAEFAGVNDCRSIDDKVPFTIRLWGNGGVFAGTGIFWNRLYGVFRMYVTTAKQSEFVLVETEKQTVIISPENPRVFMDHWNSEKTNNQSVAQIMRKLTCQQMRKRSCHGVH